MSRSPLGFSEYMMMLTVEFCAAFGLTVSEKKTETIHMPEPHTAARTLRTTAVGQEYVSHRVMLYEDAFTTTTVSVRA